ncbi:hypothetical protein [Pseudoalteromonas sp. NGC95]|uniref:hypothetical protein n=1 Tax=Pseudoalteromonas sp. NGC95 TaxID=2792051 RepID=UPI0018CC91B5|nr:hypothetical protein [Pseudoalteromonas sp. NGC95]MBH0018737.1 hypothetical protein [Pseudoalteromonas sp. NGC95]
MADDAGISALINFTNRCVRNVILHRTFNSLANLLGLLPNNRNINDSGVIVKVEQQKPNVEKTAVLAEETVSDEDFAALLANQLD